jgi:hypothetical protein
MDAVLLDTCVLLKSYLCDTLLSIAEEGVYRPLWSEHVLAELRRNLINAGGKQEAVEHRPAQMAAYFPDARVTENLKDFPPAAVAHLGITVVGQDDFLSGLLELYADAVLDALRRQASRYRREPRTAIALLNVLASPGQGCPEFAGQCRALL